MRRKKTITPNDGYYFAQRRQEVARRKKSRHGCMFFIVIIIAVCFVFKNYIIEIYDQTTSIITNDNFATPTSTASPTVAPTATPTPTSTPVPITIEIETSDYHYSLLSEYNQIIYQIVYQGMTDFETEINLTSFSIDNNDIVEVLRAINLDQGDIFWVENSYNYSIYEESQLVSKLSPSYALTEEEIINYQTLLEEKVAEIVAMTEFFETDYEKALFLYEYLIENTEYNTAMSDLLSSDNKGFDLSQSLVGVILYGDGICSGYSQAYSYILDEIGIISFCVSGSADGQSHQWNIIYLDGQAYHVDATWGDPVASDGTSNSINYNYFCLTTEDISKTHSMDYDYPLCTATEYNYYLKNNLYFSEYSKEAITELFETAISNSESTILLKFSNLEAYETAMNNLIESNDCFDILSLFSDVIKHDQYNYLPDSNNYLPDSNNYTIEIKFEYLE